MNPLLQGIFKTLVTVVPAFIAPTLLAAVDHPTGGLGSALSTNPVYGIAWAGLSLTLHNIYDHYYGAPQAPTSH